MTGSECLDQNLQKNKAQSYMIRDTLRSSLDEGRYVPVSFSMGEYMDFYLYHYLTEEKKLKYNTFVSYRSIWKNHLSSFLADRKMKDLSI